MESFFTQSATLSRPTTTQDASGYPVPTFATLASAVMCRIEEARGSEAIQYQRETNRKLYRGYLPKDQDLAPQDRVVCGGLTYEVVNVRPILGTDGLGINVEIDLERTV